MPPAHRAGHRRVLALLLGALGVATLIFVAVAVLAPPPPAPHCGPLQCQGPPIGHPVPGQGAAAALPVTSGVRYTTSAGYSLRNVASGGPAPTVTSSPDAGILLVYSLSKGVTTQLQVAGAPAGGTTAQGIVQATIDQVAPGAQPVYEVPGASIGYVAGFGEAYDLQSASSSGSTATERVIVIAAIHNGFGIVAIASGPRIDVTADSPYFAGHPSPANVPVAYLASLGDPVLNSVTFPGT